MIATMTMMTTKWGFKGKRMRRFILVQNLKNDWNKGIQKTVFRFPSSGLLQWENKRWLSMVESLKVWASKLENPVLAKESCYWLSNISDLTHFSVFLLFVSSAFSLRLTLELCPVQVSDVQSVGIVWGLRVGFWTLDISPRYFLTGNETSALRSAGLVPPMHRPHHCSLSESYPGAHKKGVTLNP